MDLYQEILLDHNRAPRNFGRLATANHSAVGHNPLCGDRLVVYVQVHEGILEAISFEGAGCAISTASASLMTDAVKGRPISEALHLFEGVIDMITGDPSVTHEPATELGKMVAFSGVREYPMRVKCATLAWHTLRAALETAPAPVTTE